MLTLAASSRRFAGRTSYGRNVAARPVVSVRSARQPISHPELLPVQSYAPYTAPQSFAASKVKIIEIVQESNGAYVLFFDIDGTLNESAYTGSPGQIVDDALEALRRMHGAGGKFFIVGITGRSLEDAEAAFGDVPVILACNDGSTIKLLDGTVLEMPRPIVPEFDFLKEAIVQKEFIGARDLGLPKGSGVSFPSTLAGLIGFSYYKQIYQLLVNARDDLELHNHRYIGEPGSEELVVTSKEYTKAWAMVFIIGYLKEAFELDFVIADAFGNGPNDLGMLEKAMQLGEGEKKGSSYWVGGMRDDVTGCFKRVRDLQLAIILLCEKVAVAFPRDEQAA